MWQPIDTAPKDGTHVLIRAAHGAVEAWWKRSESVTGKYPATEGWRYYEPAGRLVPEAHGVTGWMPLPDA